MRNKAEFVTFVSITLGVICFFLPSEYLLYSVFLISLGIVIGIVKAMWGVAGWASKKIE